jgi:hypothetical protein
MAGPEAETALVRRAREARYSARYLINGFPAIYLPLARLRHGGREDRLVRRDTELVIEGFGRSGNTFAVVAFELAQTRPVRLVHHSHAAAQVIRAVRLGVPVLLVVRDPVDTAVSHMMFRDIAARPALSAWVRYHARLLPHLGGVVVSSFEAATEDFGSVIRHVNDRFNTSFTEFRHSEENVRRVFDRIEQQNRARYGQVTETISRPRAERDRRKADLRRQVEQERLARIRERASGIYRRLMAAGDA